MSTKFVKSIIMPDGTELSLSGVPTGGTTGQILAKKSNADGDAAWVNASPSGDFVSREEFDATIGDLEAALDAIIG